MSYPRNVVIFALHFLCILCHVRAEQNLLSPGLYYANSLNPCNLGKELWKAKWDYTCWVTTRSVTTPILL